MGSKVEEGPITYVGSKAEEVCVVNGCLMSPLSTADAVYTLIQSACHFSFECFS